MEEITDTTPEHDAIITQFKKDRTNSQEHWNPIYNRSKARRKFTLLGKQMEASESSRYNLKNPMMPNLLLTYVNHEANNTLQTDYLGKVTPNGSGATEDQARARQDVLRGLQRMHNISQIFNFARRDQVATGIAYSSVKLEFAKARGFGKTIKDEYIFNTYDTYPSPNVKTSTFSDSRYWISKKMVPKDEWKAETGQEPSGFGSKKTKEIWYYWVKQTQEDTEYLTDGGLNTKLESEFETEDTLDEYEQPIGTKPVLDGVELGEDGEPLGRGVSQDFWKWYKISEDLKVLDEEDWLGSESPITACTGRKVVDGDQTYYQSMTEFAEEPQKIYTIIENIIMLRLGRSPYSRWKVAFESIDPNILKDLKTASVAGDLDIIYKSRDKDGNVIASPEEVQPYILDRVLIELQQQQEIKIQKIFGIFEANIGQRSNEQSGVAIKERSKGGEQSNYDYMFNFLEYVEQVTRVKLDLIPKYMTAPQQVAFVDPEDVATIQWINTEGGIQFNPNEEYALAIEASPISDTSKKEEAEFLANAAKNSALIAQNPEAMSIVIGAQPGRGAKALAEVLKGTDPRLQQAQQIIGQLQEQLKETTESAEAKIRENSIREESLQAVIKIMSKQIQLIRAAGQADKAVSDAESAQNDISPMLQTMEQQLKAMEINIAQEEADTNRIQANNETVRVATDAAQAQAPEKLDGGSPKPNFGAMYNL